MGEPGAKAACGTEQACESKARRERDAHGFPGLFAHFAEQVLCQALGAFGGIPGHLLGEILFNVGFAGLPVRHVGRGVWGFEGEIANHWLRLHRNRGKDCEACAIWGMRHFFVGALRWRGRAPILTGDE
jgi:hypothetical protein